MVLENFITFMNKIMLFSGYINRVSCFPKPLTIEEEKELIKEMQNGNEKAKEKLINHNLRLVAHIVKKYNGSGEAEDLISVGAIGLIKAINTFSPEKNTQLSTYAARCIENEILMLLRVNKKHTQNLSLNDCLGNDKDGNEIVLEDILPQENNEMEEIEKQDSYKKMYYYLKQVLSKREYDIIVMRYGLFGTKALTQIEIAKKLGISRSYISRIESKAIKELQKYKKEIM